MVYTGRIFDIVHVNDKVSQIILRKKDKDKIVPVAVKVMGYWKEKAFNELKLKPKDKIKGNLYLKSSLYQGKYYTDVFFREIYLVEPAPVNMNLFHTEDGVVDLDSGEIVEN